MSDLSQSWKSAQTNVGWMARVQIKENNYKVNKEKRNMKKAVKTKKISGNCMNKKIELKNNNNSTLFKQAHCSNPHEAE